MCFIEKQNDFKWKFEKHIEVWLNWFNILEVYLLLEQKHVTSRSEQKLFSFKILQLKHVLFFLRGETHTHVRVLKRAFVSLNQGQKTNRCRVNVLPKYLYFNWFYKDSELDLQPHLQKLRKLVIFLDKIQKGNVV